MNVFHRIGVMGRLVAAVALAIPLAAFSQGVSDKQILIGRTASVTGPVAELLKEGNVGFDAGLKEINDKGGIYGRKIVPILLDDGFIPKRAAENVRKLLDQKVFLLFNPNGTALLFEILPIAEAARLPVFGAGTGADTLRVPAKFSKVLFHIRSGYRDEVRGVMKHLAVIGRDRIVIPYQNDAFGKVMVEACKEFAQEFGVKVAAYVPLERDGKGVEEMGKMIAEHNPSAVYLATGGQYSWAPVQDLIDRRMISSTYGNTLVGTEELYKKFGEKLHGMVVAKGPIYPWNAANPFVRQYQNAMQANGSTNYSYSSLEGYFQIQLLAEGLRRAGPNPTRESYISGLERAPLELPGSGVRLNYTDKNHNGSPVIDLVMVRQNGGFSR